MVPDVAADRALSARREPRGRAGSYRSYKKKIGNLGAAESLGGDYG
jgi:hypothetical protein